MTENTAALNVMTVKLDTLPPKKEFIDGIRRAPARKLNLSRAEIKLALKNALRYIPKEWQQELAPEFLQELLTRGRIYGYRFRPSGRIYGKPMDEYEGNCLAGKAFQVMIDNNLDFEIALYPYELVTYGETGQVFQNWMQYVLVKKYLQTMTEEQTLVIASGHPVGLFASNRQAPRVMITNGLMIGMFDTAENFHKAAAIGVANYGQMTAGGWMYIGPQGIVHGTYSTLLNAARSKCNLASNQSSLSGILFVSSGLGGMSGAQGRAMEILGGVSVIAEVDLSRIQTRYSQSWVSDIANTPKHAFELAKEYLNKKQKRAIAFHGNVVDLLQYAIDNEIKIDLLSDQTSCHAVYEGGYCPQGLTYEERTELLKNDSKAFRNKVNESLKKHFEFIKRLTEKGTYFFDYGNSFLKAAYDAGVKEVVKNGIDEKDGFIFPSYVEDILGPLLFDYGYGPFRWVVLSGKESDLEKTDRAAMDCIDPNRRFQDRDNYQWIKNAKENNLVVGTKARILYQDAFGRMKIALRFNEMIRNKEISPIMLGRDHHDTGGTDSPFRETSNIKDGSNIMAEMAVHTFAGNAARGMSLVALHNGGGVGIGKSVNGGFGLLLDGSLETDEIIRSAMVFDVMNGVARRSWARNENALQTCVEFNKISKNSHVILPYLTEDELIEKTLKELYL